MNIKKKPIETMRFSKETGKKLKDKSIEITLKIKDLVSEQELVNYLVETQLELMCQKMESCTSKMKMSKNSLQGSNTGY